MYIILQFPKYCFNRVDDQAEASSSKHAINDDNLTMEQIYRNKALHELTNQSILVLNLSFSILTGKISTEEAYLHQKRELLCQQKREKNIQTVQSNSIVKSVLTVHNFSHLF